MTGRGCPDAAEDLASTLGFGELLKERRASVPQPLKAAGGIGTFIPAGQRAVEEDLARTARSWHGATSIHRAAAALLDPLPPTSTATIDGKIGDAAIKDVSASVESGWLSLRVGVRTSKVSQNDIAIFFDTKGSNQPDFYLRHQLNPANLYEFSYMRTWTVDAGTVDKCQDSDDYSYLVFRFKPRAYTLRIPLECLDNPPGLRLAVATAKYVEATGDFSGVQWYPRKRSLTGWLLASD